MNNFNFITFKYTFAELFGYQPLDMQTNDNNYSLELDLDLSPALFSLYIVTHIILIYVF